MPLLSIIVPVYNKERYIDDCLRSVLVQTFKDFELILVDDGSTDSSGERCDNYKETDSRITVFHQENQGVSASRNVGLRESNGKFIGFVDSDDVLEPDMFEILINNILSTKADISICNMHTTAIEGDVKRINNKNTNYYIYDRKTALVKFFNEEFTMSANNKIYKKDVLKDLQFEGSMFEDAFFVFQSLLKATKIVYTPQEKYINIPRKNSVSISTFSPKYFQVTDNTEKMVDWVQKKLPELLENAKVLDFVMTLSQINLILLSSNKKEFRQEYYTSLRKLYQYNSSIKKTNKVKFKHRIAYYILRATPTFYSFLMELYCITARRTIVQRTEKTNLLRRLLYPNS